MKKLLIFVCMLACVFGLTACGSEKTLTEYEQQKVDSAKLLAAQIVVPMIQMYTTENYDGYFDGYTMEEIATLVQSNQYNVYQQVLFDVDGYAVYKAVDSFRSALKDMGSILSVGDAEAEIDGDQIVVNVQVNGEKKNATAEVIFSNDMFFRLESASLNPTSTMGELMTGAALNTLIGMGTVFAVLILISCIISCFKLVGRFQNKAAQKEAAKAAGAPAAGVDNAVTQIETQEETTGDDLELAAVIAAAVAAYEGSASADGFVVRSIRRLR